LFETSRIVLPDLSPANRHLFKQLLQQ
jgi:hypothetical protein